jgi:hypothetical protein
MFLCGVWALSGVAPASANGALQTRLIADHALWADVQRSSFAALGPTVDTPTGAVASLWRSRNNGAFVPRAGAAFAGFTVEQRVAPGFVWGDPLRPTAVVVGDGRYAQGPLAELSTAKGGGSGDALGSRAPLPSVPDQYAWVEDETRAFWFAVGTGAAATLGLHLLAGVPLMAGLVLPVAVGAGAASAPLGLALFLGGAVVYFAAESLLSALVSTLVFNAMSTVYDGSYIAGSVAHFAGNIAAGVVGCLLLGGAALSLHGTLLLAEFTAGAGIEALGTTLALASLPGVVAIAAAFVLAPPLLGAWALSVAASPKPGVVIDDEWLAPRAHAIEPTSRDRLVAVLPLLRLSLPAP